MFELSPSFLRQMLHVFKAAKKKCWSIDIVAILLDLLNSLIYFLFFCLYLLHIFSVITELAVKLIVAVDLRYNIQNVAIELLFG